MLVKVASLQVVLLIVLTSRVFRREHNMVRFRHGEPAGVYFSQHEGGKAYNWDDYSFDHTWEMEGEYNWKILADNYNVSSIQQDKPE